MAHLCFKQVSLLSKRSETRYKVAPKRINAKTMGTASKRARESRIRHFQDSQARDAVQ